MTIDELQKQCLEDSERWFPSVSSDLALVTLALCGEAGELANVVKKFERGSIPYVDAHYDISLELADVFIYLLNVAEILNIDLEEEYRSKRRFNEERFGNGQQ